MEKRTAPLSGVLTEAKHLVNEDNTLQQELETLEKRLAENTFKLAIVALVKCGKSTINNAFIGHNLLPANTIPETSALTSILHNPSLHEPLLKAYDTRELLENSRDGVVERITYINKNIREGKLEDDSWKKLLLEANVTALNGNSSSSSSCYPL